jgi:formate dehydrogenase maturation protein FdhE
VEICADINSKIFTRLQDWEDKNGQLPAFIQYYRELMRIQSGICETAVSRPGINSDILSEREGVPLLLFEDFQPDWQQVKQAFNDVFIWATRDSEGSPEEKQALHSLSNNLYLLKTIIEKQYHHDSFQDIPEVENIDNNLLISIIAAVLKPFLRVYAKCLLPEVDQERWRRPYCPVCGSKPDFSYIDREKGARWLVCSCCDAEWLFLRLECPYCGTSNNNNLSYFTDEADLNLYRLYICKQCNTYIKSIDLRRAGLDVLLPLERLTTLKLDKQAQEMGYRPGYLSP